MTTLDQVRSDLARLAERGDTRSAPAVFEAALAMDDHPPRRRTSGNQRARVLVALAATVSIVGLAIGITSLSQDSPSAVRSVDHPSALPPSVPPTGDNPGRRIAGTFADGARWTVGHDPDHGLCVVMADVNLGCDDVGPVLPPGADPTTVRWGLDGDRWLAYGELPADAVGVAVVPRAGQPPGAEPVVDRQARLWAVPGDNPAQVFDVGSGYTVHYQLADGSLRNAPRQS